MTNLTCAETMSCLDWTFVHGVLRKGTLKSSAERMAQLGRRQWACFTPPLCAVAKDYYGLSNEESRSARVAEMAWRYRTENR